MLIHLVKALPCLPSEIPEFTLDTVELVMDALKKAGIVSRWAHGRRGQQTIRGPSSGDSLPVSYRSVPARIGVPGPALTS